jgi:peptidyl-prolyl cis-trans isomerase SurA
MEDRYQAVMQQIQTNQQRMPTEAQLVEIREQLLEQLISETIQIQLATRSGMRIDDNTLNDYMNDLAQQNNMDFDTFRSILDEQGIYNQTRQQLSRELLISEFQRRAVNQRIDVTRQEVENYLRSEAGVSSVQPEYRVAHILIPVEGAANTDRQAELAELLYTRLEDGENILAITATNSVLGMTISGGDLGWNKVETLPSIFREVVPQLEAGMTAEPFLSSSGYHVVQLLETRGGASLTVPQTHLRHIMIAPNEIRTDAQADVLIHELYERVINGEDFADVARQNTDDVASIVSGGDLDWVSPGQLPPDFMAVIEETPIDGISEPFLSEQGWHFIQVLGRRDEDMTEENKKHRADQVLRSRKYEMELQNWLTELRDTSYVNIIEEN